MAHKLKPFSASIIVHCYWVVQNTDVEFKSQSANFRDISVPLSLSAYFNPLIGIQVPVAQQPR